MTRTEGGEVNEDEWNGSVRVCVCVYVYVYLRLCLCVCLCLSTWSGPQCLALPGLPPTPGNPVAVVLWLLLWPCCGSGCCRAVTPVAVVLWLLLLLVLFGCCHGSFLAGFLL